METKPEEKETKPEEKEVSAVLNYKDKDYRYIETKKKLKGHSWRGEAQYEITQKFLDPLPLASFSAERVAARSYDSMIKELKIDKEESVVLEQRSECDDYHPDKCQGWDDLKVKASDGKEYDFSIYWYDGDGTYNSDVQWRLSGTEEWKKVE